MNILFIDILQKNNKNTLIKLKGKNIYYISINTGLLDNNFQRFILKLKLKKILSTKTYIVLSKYAQEDSKILKYIDEIFKDYVIVTGQNNLYTNDEIYIGDYIRKRKIAPQDIKVLIVIDKLGYNEKEKINQMIGLFKIVDIYATKNIHGIDKFISELNNTFGTIVETIDKIPFAYYNIFLVFSSIVENIGDQSSFILDYNNSDLDVKSNTYLIYKKNEKMFKYIFSNLGMDILRFEKTKLGKLYIHASGLMLDI